MSTGMRKLITKRSGPIGRHVISPADLKKRNKENSNGHGEAHLKELLEILKEVKNGNFAVRLPSDETGTTGKVFETLNDIIAMNEKMMEEFTKARNTIGKEGKLTQRIILPSNKGSWNQGVTSLNELISDLVYPTIEIANVISSVAKGNLSQQMPEEIADHKLEGEFLRIAKEVNHMVKQLNLFSMEVTRVAREVGSEGKLGGQAKVRGVDGVWKDLTDSVNQMAGNLTNQVRNVAEVTTAIAKGNLAKKITVDVKGEMLELKNTINTLVDQLNSFGSEVTRVALEVGTEGKLGGQATVKGVGGIWKDLTDSVNQMASNLTGQVRNIAGVTTAVAKGDLSKKIEVDVRGEMLELKNTINTMVDQLNSFGSEVTRVAREVGSEGQLGGQADVPGVGGTWKDLTDSVNKMADNLTNQVRNIADVTIAVAKGDLSKKITVDVKGEMLELKDTINTMVDQLNSFASEVTRVASEVGSEGKLGGQATVKGVAGVWKGLTDSVNQMAGNLTAQIRNIADVSIAVANGDLSKKITVDVRGEILQLKETINTMVDQLRGFASEVTRVAREVGTDGKLGGQAFVPGVAGTWKDLTDSVNGMAGNLTDQVRNIAGVTTAVANGDLSKKITVDVRGEMLELKNTINTMVEQLNSFAFEVTRVAREVGTEGKLGGQAEVRGVAGTWKDLTDSVNQMASNLTGQVRGIAKVVTSVAKGNLRQKLSINALGELAQLTDTINEMIDTLAVFADQVTNVAREVGVEGRLGGQASVPGASGTWKALTENVNQLAANLTTQVRSISEVASAVTKGDLTRNIRVEAQGELEALKDTINQMITNLRETTLRNQDQDWLKSNLAAFTQMLQGQKDLNTVTKRILSELAQVVSAHYGAFYILQQGDERQNVKLKLFAAYAYKDENNIPKEFAVGEGLVGQCAFEKERILLTNVPTEYVKINSGLGKARPTNLVILPVLFENNVKAVIELASLDFFSETHLDFLNQLTESIGIVLNTIETNSRTEELLEQSQSLAGELKTQQEELKRTNDELQDKALLLVKQKNEVEAKNKEVEEARRSLEEKAEQLMLTSKYKSEFLANMSHELRTPLNSLSILAQQLYENADGNLNEKQVRYAKTIHSCGDDLIQLINDILDLSKIESGFISANISSVRIVDIASFAETTFKPISESKNVSFNIETDNQLPASIDTDSQRLNQILKNLLSNAFKFTEKGEVKLKIFNTRSGWKQGTPSLDNASNVIAFSISDTGIGITKEKQVIVFEAFQQAEGSTSRKYGGTGLGLSISRGLAELLGGTIELESEAGKGSVFTFYLPIDKLSKVTPKEPLENGHSPESIDTQINTMLGRKLTHERIENRSAITELLSDIEVDQSPIKQEKLVVVFYEDQNFGRTVVEAAKLKGLKGIIVTNYLEIFETLNRLAPIAIIMDVKPKDPSSWKVMSLLRSDLAYRHIPIHVISGEENRSQAIKRGAKTFVPRQTGGKSLDMLFEDIIAFNNKASKQILVIGENELYTSLLEKAHGNSLKVEVVKTGKMSIDKLRSDHFDCIVLDYDVEDISGDELVREIARVRKSFTPVIVYSNKNLGEQELENIRMNVNFFLPRQSNWIEHLLDATITLLHTEHKKLDGDSKRVIENIHNNEDVLIDKTVLVVDDDVRNLFTLTSVLERYKINVVTAESGQEAINTLFKDPHIEMVLMDIMMPEMDGYETMRKIRQEDKNNLLPIIAVTAKAMKGDREKCIEAGASDYIVKPVKIDQLLSLIRLWFQ
jgi:signal transduction histidine kinase/HAMP domain-containing protein/CheY-like chemotaxis protein